MLKKFICRRKNIVTTIFIGQLWFAFLSTDLHGLPTQLSRSDSLLIILKNSVDEEALLVTLINEMDDFKNEDEADFLNVFEKAIPHFTSLQNDTAIAHLLYAKSHLYLQLANYPDALKFFHKAYEVYTKIMLFEQMSMCLYNIAWIHHKQKNYSEFLVYSKLANQNFEKVPESYNSCSGISTLAIAYYLNDNMDLSLAYFKQYYSMAKRINDHHHIAQSLSKLGTFYGNLKIPTALDSAEKYFKMEWEAAKQDETGRSLITAGIDLGSLEVEKQNYRQALSYFHLALEKTERFRKFYEKLWILRTISETYALAGQYQEAYNAHIEYTLFKDSIFSEEKNLQVTELEKKYQTAEKDKQIITLAKEKEINEKEIQRQATLKESFIGGFISLLVVAGLFIYMQRQRIRNQKLLADKNEEIKEVNFKKQLSELELKALRAQINPHFLFNCMNSINRMILNEETENASRYLTKFSKLVRQILENSEETTVTLDDELMMLETYIQLEALRFKGKISYSIIVDKAIERESTYLPPMVLQPFVENAIWHGLMHKVPEEEGTLEIAIKGEKDRLVCVIQDNGVGREKARILQESAVLKSKSLGMKITEERLRLLSKERLEQLVNVTDLKDAMNFAMGTRVEINIPIHG